MKNIRFNRNKIGAFLVAMGIGFSCHYALADVFSYNNKATLKDGREIKVYFTTGNTDSDYAYISLGNQIGYVGINNINMDGLVLNNDYSEYQNNLMITTDNANVYYGPDNNQGIVCTLHKNDIVHTAAKSIDGWYIVTADSFTGFIHESAFTEEKRTIRVNGTGVNVRSTPSTKNKNNILGKVNTGDVFNLISYEGNWYLINYYGTNAYISNQYAYEVNSNYINDDNSYVTVAKITGNNVNVRSSANTKSDTNVIGFCDVTDIFTIMDKQGDWYVVDYLGKTGYVHSKYVKEISMNKEDTKTIKMIYLTRDSEFYADTFGSYMTTLPQNQFASVIKEENGYYKVRVDGVIGYINKKYTKSLTNTFITTDLGRQICRVFKNNKEVYRAHMISGRYSMQTDLGKYKIGHMLEDYPLTEDKTVKYWMQYNDNEGYHDAYWQDDINFVNVAKYAYDRFASGRAVTYPYSHGSHGCDNLRENDAYNIFQLLHVGDDVLIIQANDLVKKKLISNSANEIEEQKVKKLV